MMTSVNTLDDDGSTQPTVLLNKSTSLFSKPYRDFSHLAQLQIEKARLKFLRKCSTLKRPPTSIRVSGAPAIGDTQKLFHFSCMETKLLGFSIKNKLNLVRSLSEKASPSQDPLPQKDYVSLSKHFDKKLAFFKQQDATKWKTWPRKTAAILKNIADSKDTNYKNRENQRRRKVEKQARKALEDGTVIVLVDLEDEIPLGAVSVLSKGLGFIPTPEIDTMDTRLDMRLTVNRILTSSRNSISSDTTDQANSVTDSPSSTSEDHLLPSKLSHKSYYMSTCDDREVNDIVNSMQSDLDQILQAQRPKKRKKQNLTPCEEKGLKWLQKNVSTKTISIVSADKGGSTLIVDPQMLRKKTLEKLENPNLYRKLEKDPLPALQKELFQLWVLGKENLFVSPEEAKYVMGVSDNMKTDGTGPTNRPSTAPRYKPGKSYFYPSLKVHKLKAVDLKPGVEPPIRLISALQDGISKRSDVFVAAKFLRALERDFCSDLLTDTTDALLWLDDTNQTSTPHDKMHFKSFTFDFKALYDSLSPDLVLEALEHAMNSCRNDIWSPEFKKWILLLVKQSLKSSIGIFEDMWYEQVNGVPTGGSLCVQLANIAVFYILNKYVYSNKTLMKDVTSVKRFIDDGAGHFKGTLRQFDTWISKVNEAIAPFGLNIDEFQIENVGCYVNFLDIKFMFDCEGNLQTDLYVKETASRAYLHFNSSHPNHVFSGIVYSQCLRLRRIINCNERLKLQLESLKTAFIQSGYPKKMIENIATKVLNSARIITRKQRTDEQKPLSAVPVRVISSFGSDEDLLSVVQKYEPHLRRTRSFSEGDSSPSSCEGGKQPISRNKGNLFQFVKKTGASLRARLVNTKELALGPKFGKTTPCNGKKCKCCPLIIEDEVFTVNGKRVRAAPGSCKTYNIIYLVQCSICGKPYVGRTVNSLHVRMDGHRAKFYEIIDGRAVDITSDDYSLGVHLLDHGLREHGDFNKYFDVCIIENSSPRLLEVKENKYIHILKTLRPHGLNTVNPFGLSMFH